MSMVDVFGYKQEAHDSSDILLFKTHRLRLKCTVLKNEFCECIIEDHRRIENVFKWSFNILIFCVVCFEIGSEQNQTCHLMSSWCTWYVIISSSFHLVIVSLKTHRLSLKCTVLKNAFCEYTFVLILKSENVFKWSFNILIFCVVCFKIGSEQNETCRVVSLLCTWCVVNQAYFSM
jgi:hypothetical protein